MEKTRSMLSSVSLGQVFKAEAVEIVCYLVNRSPSSALEDKIPKEEEESDSIAEEESKDEEPKTLAVKRSVRERRQPNKYIPSAFYSNFYLSITNDDPITMREAVDSEDGKLWKKVMVDEMAYFHKNEAWNLVDLSAGRKPIGIEWVFKKKMNAEGKVEKCKARLVAKAYS
eukprot:PITA_34009